MAIPQHETSACSNFGYGGSPFVWYFPLFMVRGPWESWVPGKAELARRLGPMYCPQLTISSPLCIAAVDGARMETGIVLLCQRWKGNMVGSMLQLWGNGTSETLCGVPELSQLAKGRSLTQIFIRFLKHNTLFSCLISCYGTLRSVMVDILVVCSVLDPLEGQML